MVRPLQRAILRFESTLFSRDCVHEAREGRWSFGRTRKHISPYQKRACVQIQISEVKQEEAETRSSFLILESVVNGISKGIAEFLRLRASNEVEK